MARNGYMPSTQVGKVAWSRNAVSVMGPNSSSYGIPAPVMADFIAIDTTLQACWLAASEKSTRTQGANAAKLNALVAMQQAAQKIVSLVQGTEGVTDQMKIDAGITVRKSKPSPKPIPDMAPFVTITGVQARTVQFELRQSRTKRGKPNSVASATLFTASGPVAPADITDWRYQMITTLTTGEIDFGASATGDTVHICGFWSNPRGESGPTSTPVSVNLPAGGALPSAKTESKLRLADAA